MKTINHVISLEKEALNQWSGGNPIGYGIHAHPNMIYFDNLGAQQQVEGWAAVEKYMKVAFAELPAHTYKMVGLKAKEYGTVIILSYQYHPTLSDGTPSSKWAATVVYALFQTEWKMVHANWVMLMEPGVQN